MMEAKPLSTSQFIFDGQLCEVEIDNPKSSNKNKTYCEEIKVIENMIKDFRSAFVN